MWEAESMLSFIRHFFGKRDKEAPLDPRVIEFQAVLEDKGVIPGSKVSIKQIGGQRTTATFQLIEKEEDRVPVIWFEDFRVEDECSGLAHGFGIDLQDIAEIELA